MDTCDWIAAQPMLAREVLYLRAKDGTVLSYALPRRQDARREGSARDVQGAVLAKSRRLCYNGRPSGKRQ